MMKMIEVTENYSVKLLLEISNKLGLLREKLRKGKPSNDSTYFVLYWNWHSCYHNIILHSIIHFCHQTTFQVLFHAEILTHYLNQEKISFTSTNSRWRAHSSWNYFINTASASYILLLPPFPSSVVHWLSEFCVSHFNLTQKCEVLQRFFCSKNFKQHPLCL
jgi:hypothetical protein